MSEEMMVSVIVPVYNVEHYLARCINSILNQSYQNLELILVDDGSTDTSGELCDSFARKDKRIKVVHKENEGAGEARNTGIALATGSYLTFIDSDDYVADCFLERMLAVATENDCELVQCGFLFGNDAAYEFTKERKAEVRPMIYDGHSVFYTRNAKIIICAKLFRRELFEGIRYPRISIHDDEFITYKLFYRAKKIALMDIPYYYYYNSDNSIMRNGKSYYPDNFIQAYEERIRFFEEKKETELALISYKEMSVRLAQLYGRCALAKKNQNDKKKILKQYKDYYQTAKKAPMSAKEALFLKGFFYCPAAMPRLMKLAKFI